LYLWLDRLHLALRDHDLLLRYQQYDPDDDRDDHDRHTKAISREDFDEKDKEVIHRTIEDFSKK